MLNFPTKFSHSPWKTFLSHGLFLILLGLLNACTLIPPPSDTTFAEPAPYVSEVELTEAKAYYAYLRFRMLVFEGRWDEGIDALKLALEYDPESARLRMTLAKGYLHLREFEAAAEVLEQLLAQKSATGDAWQLLGELRAYQTLYPAAIRAYEQALKQDPANENLQLRLISVYELSGNTLAALSQARNLLATQPDSLRALLAQARLLQRNQQPHEAIAAYQQLMRRHPDYWQAVLELGRLLEKENQPEKAKELYLQALENNPSQTEIYQQFARFLINKKNYAEALNRLEQARVQKPADVNILTRMGLLQLSLARFAAAEETFRRILQFDPNQAQTLYSLGVALVGQNRGSEALDAFQSIPRDREIYPQAALQIAYLYQQQNQTERSIEILQQALVEGEESPEIYFYLAAFLSGEDRLDEARKLLLEGTELYPEEARLNYQLGVVYESMQNRDAALQQMENVLRLEAKNADALNFIAYHYAEQGVQLEKALTLAQQALEQKETSYIYDTLGWIYYRMERYPEARDLLEKAIELAPVDDVIYLHLADTYTKMRLWLLAKQAYGRALENNPDADEVRRKLETLQKEHPDL